MKRRSFIKYTAPTVAAPFVLGKMSLSALAEEDLPIDPCSLATDRSIVIIKLGGGTDGINLVVPIDQYSTYAGLRPTIKHDLADLIQLDPSMAAGDQVGLHPGMQKFKDLYDNGNFHIIQGVSYPNANRSHFRSTKIMQAGLQGNSSLSNTSGWAARYLKHSFNPDLFTDPLGISIGGDGIFNHNFADRYHISLVPGGVDSMYTFANTLSNDIENTSSQSDYHKALDHIITTNEGIGQYADRIYNVYNSGSNTSSVTYGNDELAAALKLVARLISGGSTTKVFSLNMGGWDTHNNEIARQNNLVSKLTSAIDAFLADLSAQNLDHRVIGATYSEMGRAVAQNANGGTDHGVVFPMFAFGGGVNAGISGTNVNLSNIVSNNLQNPQHDYRQVLTTMMQDWLGSDSTCVTDAGFGSFLPQKVNMLDSDEVVAESCYTVVQESTQARLAQDSVFSEEQKDHIDIYPNPSYGEFNVDFYSSIEDDGYLKIIDIKGHEVFRKELVIFEEDNSYSVSVNVPSGVYAVMLITERQGVIAGNYVIIK